MKIEKVQLDADQKQFLTGYISKGTRSARSIRRARTLLLLDGGELNQKEVATQLGCAPNTVYNTLCRYKECGGDVAQTLIEKPRSGQPTKITPTIEAHATALACSRSGPDGRSTWTLRMIADNLVELGHIASISHEAVRQCLKKASLSPGRKSSGASAR